MKSDAEKHMHHDCHEHNQKECECQSHHEHKHEECSCHGHHEHTHEGCGCHGHHEHNGHDCGCGHSHSHMEYSKKHILIKGLSLILFALSLSIKGQIIPWIVCTIAVIICGYEFFVQGIKSLIKLKFDENTLIVIAALASIIMKEQNEAYLITVLFSLGQFLEGYAVEKSRKRIENLIDTTVDTAHNELGERISPELLREGDTFLAKPGDKICVDAVLTSLSGVFDASAITGESMPITLEKGDAVISGYINIGSSVTCTATCDYHNSTASKIKRYVENASERKSATESFITKFASVYTPAVICIAIVMGIGLAISGITTPYEAFRRALTFMIASCPCAIVISIPLAYYASVGAMSKYGLLVKGSKYINEMAKADAIAFDKTGTITTGKLSVSNVIFYEDTDVRDVIAIAKSLEIHSLHPIAQAICKYHTGEILTAENVKEHIGKGMEGYVENRFVVVGTPALATEKGYDIPEDSKGILVYIDGTLTAEITVEDSMRNDSKDAVSLLKEMGLKVCILSGDNKDNAEKVAAKMDIDFFHSLSPEEKAKKISELKNAHKGVIFAGDGVNDAPSLSEADFSVSIGSGSSLALETGDSTLISSRLTTIPKSIKKARYTMNVVYTNIVLAIVIKFAVLALAAGGLAPIWLAVLADVGTLILTVINSLTVFIKK